MQIAPKKAPARGVNIASLDLLHMPTCRSSDLMAHLSRALTSSNLTEDWFSLLPSRVGHSLLVDQAAIALISTVSCGLSDSGASRTVAYSNYCLAIGSLRTTLTRPMRQAQDLDNLVLAVALLACLECCLEKNGDGMYKHMSGINHVLTSTALFHRPTETAAALLYWDWMGTFQIPVACGIASPFDAPQWLDLEPRSSVVLDADINGLRRIGYRLFIRLPRLIALVRELRESSKQLTEHDVRIEEASRLLEELSAWDGSHFETALLHRVPVQRTVDSEDAYIIPYCLAIPKLSIFQPLIYFWQTRIILNRLAMQVEFLKIPSEEANPSCIPAIKHLRDENSRMAVNILMAWPYASHCGRFGLWAMILGWVSLWGVLVDEARANLTDTPATWRGKPLRHVQRWVLSCCTQFDHRGQRYTMRAMDEAADVVLGGPLVGFLVEPFRAAS